MPTETPEQRAERTATAMSLIRGSALSRLTDRAWLLPVIACVFICLAAYQRMIEWELAVKLITALIAVPSGLEKAKDAVIGAAAVKPPAGSSE